MATSRKTNDRPAEAGPAGAAGDAAQLSKGLGEAAQQIWLAGLGAFARAQAESTKLFEGLVKEGLDLEKSALKFADTQADALRGAVESGVDTATARAAGTWEQLESAVEGGVRRALTRLGVPDREDISELSRRVESLSAELRRQQGINAAPPGPSRRSPATGKATAARSGSTGSPSATKAAKPARPANAATKAARKPASKAASKSAAATRK